MNPAALKASWAMIARHGDAVPGFFYAWLFTTNPHLREYFPMSMAGQRDRLVGALGRIVSAVDQLDSVVPFVQELGRDHRRFDVKPDHYPAVGQALLATLEHFLGPSWTPELAQDWAAAYDLVSATMIDAAEQAPGPPYWTATVVNHERRGFDVAVVGLRAEQRYPYRAGQACAIELPARPRVWRYYSIGNAPRLDDVLELHVKAVPGGQVSTAVVSGLSEGTQIRIGPPIGHALALDTSSQRPVLMVAGGTGLAPLKALIEQNAADGGQRRITLLVGARTQADLYDLDALNDMRGWWPWLTVVPVLSDDPWHAGQRGTVAEAAGRMGPWQDHDVLICGSSGMVTATRRWLAAAGVPVDRIRYEDDTCDPFRPPTAGDQTVDVQEEAP